MRKKPRVQCHLSDLKGLATPSEKEISIILRAADEIIFKAGRTMLAKILKGSKDKKIVELQLDQEPSYGYFNHLTIEEITKIIDWMIVNDYLDIDCDERLPLIIFSARGWERYKPIYVEELFLKILFLDEDQTEDIINQLKQTNRQVIEMLLLRIGESGNNQFIEFMIKWEDTEVKKVRTLINHSISNLKLECHSEI